MKTTKKLMALAVMLLAMSQSVWAGGTYKWVWTKAMVSGPTGAGEVYIEYEESETKLDEYKKSKQGTEASLRGILYGGDFDKAYIQAIPTKSDRNHLEGYVCLGVTTEEKTTYDNDDFSVGVLQNEGDYAGFYKITVDPGDNREGNGEYDTVFNKKDLGYDTEEEKTAKDKWYPQSPDFGFYAIFKKVYKYANGQAPGDCGTIGTITATVDTDDRKKITLNAVANPGNRFVKWKEYNSDGSVINDNYSTVSSVDITYESISSANDNYYEAVFETIPITLGEDGIATYSNAKGVRISDSDYANYQAYPAKLEDGRLKLLTTGGLKGVPNSQNGPNDKHGAIIIGTPNTTLNLTVASYLAELEFYNAFASEEDKDPKGRFDTDELKGTSLTTVIEDDSSGKYYYCLGKKNGVIGFYKVNNGVEIPQNKAYIEISGGEAKEFIGFSDDPETTAIANLISQRMEKGESYNLQGQRVEDSYQGIIIKNGRKYINK